MLPLNVHNVIRKKGCKTKCESQESDREAG